MNYTMIPAKTCCSKCNNIQEIGAEHCSACGISFVFGKDDAWTSNSLIENTEFEIIGGYKQALREMNMYDNFYKQKCLHDYKKSEEISFLSCPCPKCTPSC